MNVFRSASKIVFVLLAASMVGLTVVGKVDPKDFMAATMMAFTYYFSKASPSGPTDTQ